jgi:hypothetical protein
MLKIIKWTKTEENIIDNTKISANSILMMPIIKKDEMVGVCDTREK